MSTNSTVNVTLYQFMVYLKELIDHIDEIPYNMQDEVMIGMMRIKYDGTYYKDAIIKPRETKYIDIINSKERRKWKADSVRNEVLIEQNDFVMRMYISKKQLGYQGELILDMHVPSNPFIHIKLYFPIKFDTQIDLDEKQLEAFAHIQSEGENMFERPFDYTMYINCKNACNKIMVLEKDNYLVEYSVENIALDKLAVSNTLLGNPDTQKDIFSMNIFKGVKLGKERDIEQVRKERTNVLNDLRKNSKEKKPQETEAMKKQRRKSVVELIQLSGIEKIMEESMKNINMCQTDRHVEVNIPLEQENHTINEVQPRGLATLARLVKQGMKPAKVEKSMEIEPSEKLVQPVRSVQPIQQPIIQTRPNVTNQVRQPIIRQPRTQNIQNFPVQHLPMRNIPQGFPPNMMNGIPIQTMQYNPNAQYNPPMINPNVRYIINPTAINNITNPMVNGMYVYPRNGFQMEQQTRQNDDHIMIERGGMTIPYNPVITIEESERFETVNINDRQADREIERKRMIFNEIMQYIQNMKEGRGEKKTYTIYLKNINSIFDNDNNPIKLNLRPKSIEFRKKDMYEKGVGRQESITSKRSNIQIESNGFYEEGKFKFGMYQINGRVEFLLMIYSDGEVLTYKVNDIQVNEQSIN